MYTSNRTWLTFFGILIALYLIDEATERLRDNRELPKKKRKWREEKKKKKKHLHTAKHHKIAMISLQVCLKCSVLRAHLVFIECKSTNIRQKHT